ncbi:tRNA pseudouridine(55) synthase TruB [bacterium]|nr:tRNA pseudouridine(55) synthase TruB [bacterium]
MHGFFLIDKPAGISSNKALSQIKRNLKIKKMGHTGTLDPFAQGLLVAASGEATKFIYYLEAADKCYEAKLQLGVKTDTLDSYGQILEKQDISKIDKDKIESVFNQFLGPQLQIPPMFSAKKVDGDKLYDLARKGIEVERKACSIEIKKLVLLDQQSDSMSFEVVCSKGTYVRVLGEDIAGALGNLGHLSYLKRISSDGFNVKDALAPEKLSGMSIPLEKLHHYLKYPLFTLDETSITALKAGKFVAHSQAGGLYSVLNDKEEFCGLVKSEGALLKPERMAMV